MKVSKEIKIAINGIFGKMGSTVFSAANDEDQIINVAGIDPIIDNVENKFSIPVYRSWILQMAKWLLVRLKWLCPKG